MWDLHTNLAFVPGHGHNTAITPDCNMFRVLCAIALLLHPAYSMDLNDPSEGYELQNRNGNGIASSRRIFFWTDTNFRGNTYTLHMRRGHCYPIGAAYQNQFSSVDTNGECVDLFMRTDCFGAMYRMEALSTRCHRNLGDCDINDAVSSVRLCQETCYNQQTGGNNKKELLALLWELMRQDEE